MNRAVLLLVPFAVAPPAEAATVSIEPRPRPANSHAAVFRAEPGERNAVTVTATATGVLFRDAQAPVQPGTGCTAAPGGGVACPEPRLEVFLEDGADTATIPSGRAVGGSGKDQLTCEAAACDLGGGLGDDVLRGGSADDLLEGGGGRDVMSGGPGDDSLEDFDVSARLIDDDKLDGGPGDDNVSYLLRKRPLTIDLLAGSGGQRGEHDRLVNIEGIISGDGDDVLRGSNRADLILGGGGDDTIVGRRGNDNLDGESGDDTVRGDAGKDGLDGGKGSDLLLARDGAEDVVSGGAGRDRAQVDRRDGVEGVERID